MARDDVAEVGSREVGLAGRLAGVRRERGMSQQALAKALAVSQATASKLLRGRQRPRPGLALRIERFLAEEGTDAVGDGLKAVVEAYESSKEFRRLCHAALTLMNENE